MNKQIEYGVFLDIHPSAKLKRVTLHKLPCSHYKQHVKSGIYTFTKNCETFDEAISRASKWSLEWHAPIKICKDCRKKWNLV